MSRRRYCSFIILLALAAKAASALTITVNNGINFGTIGLPPGLPSATVSISQAGALSSNNPTVDFLSGSGAQAASISFTGGTPDTSISFSGPPTINSLSGTGISITNVSTPFGCTLDGSGNCNINMGATATLNSPDTGTHSASNALVFTVNYT